ncbi:hypothetical protein F4780DRAFT_782377 [Xylariomycetidae sp. FL0641]|nr:hypothetical protein F4780DRAFT_782377 [Xylariomycetidae sp. FL0641]
MGVNGTTKSLTILATLFAAATAVMAAPAPDVEARDCAYYLVCIDVCGGASCTADGVLQSSDPHCDEVCDCQGVCINDK